MFKAHNMLGKGTYAIVFKTTDPDIVCKTFEENDKEAYLREVNILKYLGNFDGICKIYGHGQIEGSAMMFYSFLESIPRRLQDIDVDSLNLGDRAALGTSIIKEISNILGFLHDKKILHADIKEDNIMLRHDNSPVLIDFSNSGYLDEDGFLETSPFLVGGAFSLAAPEMLLHMMKYFKTMGMTRDCNGILTKYKDMKVSGKADMYSLGMLVYRIVCGDYTTVSIKSQPRLISKFFSETKKMRWAHNHVFQSLPETLQITMGKLLSFHADKRPTADEIAQAPIGDEPLRHTESSP